MPKPRFYVNIRDMKEEALHYHKKPPEGKLEIRSTKKVDSEWDLSLAYSPGVAEPCKEIAKEPSKVFDYTGRGNLVAVITNGTAVLGLGSIGPLASKPVMEGKAVLFKKFAGINVFDIELKTTDPDEFVQVCKNLEPTFGGINLEDIAAPACFEIEKRLKEELSIPCFHDDQHGTAIITAAALINACKIQNKKLEKIQVVFSGAGAAASSCAQLLISLGVKPSHICVCDSKGVIYKGRKEGMNSYKQSLAISTTDRTLQEAIKGADVFIGLSVKDLLTQKDIKNMAKKPIVFAMANPDPEIRPELAKEACPDVIMATGRSDYPNQVNNVLGFPFIFRGALDVRAKTINEEMKLAAVKALAELAREIVPESVAKAYSKTSFSFSSEYIIPKPFDPRVLLKVAPAVAKAAMDSGVAQKPIPDFKNYLHQLETLQSASRGFIRTTINRVKSRIKDQAPSCIFPEGHNPKILKALNALAPENIIRPILVGEEKDILTSIQQLQLRQLKNYQIISPQNSSRLPIYAEELYRLKKDKNMNKAQALELAKQNSYFSSLAVHLKDADSLITGSTDNFRNSIIPPLRVVGSGSKNILAGVNLVLLRDRILFFADTSVNIQPSSQELAHIAIATARVARFLGADPHVALLSFVSLSSNENESPKKMREAGRLIKKYEPSLPVVGEVQADVAVNSDIAHEIFKNFPLNKPANVLIFPNLDAGNIAYKLVQQMGEGEVLGPLLIGIKKPINVLQRTCSVQDIINTTVLTALKVYAYRDIQKNTEV